MTSKDENSGVNLCTIPSGNKNANTHIYVWGFHTTPPTDLTQPTGDMDYNESTQTAGAYYASALDILQNGGTAPAGKKILFTRTGTFLFGITNGYNIHIMNIECSVEASYDFIVFYGNPKVIVIQGCSFVTDYDDLISNAAPSSCIFDDCYIGEPASKVDITSGYGSAFINCIFDLGDNEGVSDAFWFFINCLFVGGNRAIRPYHNLAYNCTFYNQADCCIEGNISSYGFSAINCLFVPTLGASTSAIEMSATDLNMGLFTNNLYYGADGNPLTKPYNVDETEFTPFGSNKSIDPLFVNAGSNDFRLQPTSLALNAGKKSLDGFATIGAWQRKQYPYRVKEDGLT